MQCLYFTELLITMQEKKFTVLPTPSEMPWC